MGAWDGDTFANDTALDWLSRLQPKKPDHLLRTLQRIAGARPDAYIDLDPASAALAAAEIVAAASGHPTSGLPPEVMDWIRRRKFVPTQTNRTLAISAIDRVLERSELQELWAESPKYQKWRSGVSQMRRRLSQRPKKVDLTPPPKPKQKRVKVEAGMVVAIGPHKKKWVPAKLLHISGLPNRKGIIYVRVYALMLDEPTMPASLPSKYIGGYYTISDFIRSGKWPKLGMAEVTEVEKDALIRIVPLEGIWKGDEFLRETTKEDRKSVPMETFWPLAGIEEVVIEWLETTLQRAKPLSSED